MRLRGDSFSWGRRVTFQAHRWAGMCQDLWFHLARQYIALPRLWLLQMESSISRGFCPHVPQMWCSAGCSSRVYVSGPGLCGRVGAEEVALGGKEGVGCEDHPAVSWCVVVGGGEGVVFVVHEGHVRGGGGLVVVGCADVALDVVPEVAH